MLQVTGDAGEGAEQGASVQPHHHSHQSITALESAQCFPCYTFHFLLTTGSRTWTQAFSLCPGALLEPSITGWS